ncbi:MAG: oxidoreductase, partial [Actinomycetota bacterium]|nr:oxidoreductase [Actinomycetota bacterium]
MVATPATPRPPRSLAAVSGVVAAVVALGVGELFAALLPGAASPVVAVGAAVIDAVPPGVKTFAIAVFGLFDKVALVVGIVVFAALFGA